MGKGRKAFKLTEQNIKLQKLNQLRYKLVEEYEKTGKLNEEIIEEINKISDNLTKINKTNKKCKDLHAVSNFFQLYKF